jgi:hypothetical protein
MTKRKVPTVEDPEPDNTPTMVDLARRMDAALHEAETRRAIVEAATIALERATQEYAAAKDTVTALHTQYEAIMQHVLSDGGTVHIAKP